MVHVYSLIVPAVVLLQNLGFIVWPPEPTSDLHVPQDRMIFRAAEGIGRIGVTILPLFSVIRVEGSLEWFALVLMLLSLGFYGVGWIRYFLGDRQYSILYAPLMGVPVPMAVMPILYFVSASLVLHSIPLMVCSLIFGIGHIPASLRIQHFLQEK